MIVQLSRSVSNIGMKTILYFTYLASTYSNMRAYLIWPHVKCTLGYIYVLLPVGCNLWSIGEILRAMQSHLRIGSWLLQYTVGSPPRQWHQRYISHKRARFT